jgi:hypothetical protein
MNSSAVVYTLCKLSVSGPCPAKKKPPHHQHPPSSTLIASSRARIIASYICSWVPLSFCGGLSSSNNGGNSMYVSPLAQDRAEMFSHLRLQNGKAPFLESGRRFQRIPFLIKSDAFHVLDLARLIENIVGGARVTQTCSWGRRACKMLRSITEPKRRIRDHGGTYAVPQPAPRET